MFSELKSPHEGLQKSERFYFSNYEYYNDYEIWDKEYRNDLSKFIYNTKRKTQSRIVVYDTVSEHYDDSDHHLINVPQTEEFQGIKNMDDLIDKFVSPFFENNYEDVKAELQQNKIKVEIINLKFMQKLFDAKYQSQTKSDMKMINQIISQLIEITTNKQQKVGQTWQQEDKLQSEQFLQRWNGFQIYFKHILQKRVGMEEQDSQSTTLDHYYLQQYCIYMRWILENMVYNRYFGILLTAQPFTFFLNKIMHPLLIPLIFSYHKLENIPLAPLSQQMQQPITPSHNCLKMAFLNFDGKQLPMNLRAASLLPNSIYVSIYNQPRADELFRTQLDKQCTQFIESDYITLCQAYSQLLVRQYGGGNGKAFIYPTNSIYLRKAYSARNKLDDKGKQKSFKERTIPQMSSSEEIFTLFNDVVYTHLIDHDPDIIVLSYNGELNLSEAHFEQIVKQLTVISNHKLILFTNMTSLYKNNLQEQMQQNQYQNHIEVVHNFHELYRPYDLNKIAIQQYFNNLGCFMKISSGTYSVTPEIMCSNIDKYKQPVNVQFLQRLASFDEFRSAKNFISTIVSCQELEMLYHSYRDRELTQNRKGNETYTRKVQEVLNQFWEFQLNKDQMNKEVRYYYQQLIQQIKLEHKFIHEQGNVNETPQNTLKAYLLSQQTKLLLQNLENYKYRSYYTIEDDIKCQKIKNHKFKFQRQGEELLFEKYTQIIYLTQKKDEAFIINYRYGDERHAFLFAKTKEDEKHLGMFFVNEIYEKIEDKFGKLNLASKDIVYLNYSFCFCNEKLYLFWPQEWNIKEQIRYKLLGLHYKPPHINQMVRVSFNNSQKTHSYEYLKCRQVEGTIPAMPRFGCSCTQSNQMDENLQSFYIFGGYFNNKMDYYLMGSGINMAIIYDQESEYSIESLPKKKNKVFFSDLNKNQKMDQYHNVIKPKAHYRLEKGTGQDDLNYIYLEGGFGRQFTNYFHLFSEESYSYMINAEKMKKNSAKEAIRPRRIVQLSSPIPINQMGRYLLTTNSQNLSEMEQKFSDKCKEMFIFELVNEKKNKEIVSLLDDSYRFSEYKVDSKESYLFGYNRNIRQNLYIKCWSPQILILQGNRLHLMYITLKIDKNVNINMSSYIIPKEKDIVSMHLEEDRLLLLAKITSINYSESSRSITGKLKYVIYEGNFAHINEVIRRKELMMFPRFQFKNEFNWALPTKTIFKIDDKIVAVGGVSRQSQLFQRQDYILQNYKNRYKQKIKKLQCKQYYLQSHNPYIIPMNEYYLLYSVFSQKKVIHNQKNMEELSEVWKFKIESYYTSQAKTEEYLKVGNFQLYTFDFNTGKLTRRKPNFDEPRIVKVLPYQRFKIGLFHQCIEKVLLRLVKVETQSQELTDYVKFLKETTLKSDGYNLANFLVLNYLNFKTIFNDVQRAIREGLTISENDGFELVKSVKVLYSLINKNLLQNILLKDKQLGQPEYKFIVQDTISKKVKYMAIGPLLTTKLQFVRFRFKSQLYISLNKKIETELFFNPNTITCEEIDLKDRVRIEEQMKNQLDDEEKVYQLVVSYK